MHRVHPAMDCLFLQRCLVSFMAELAADVPVEIAPFRRRLEQPVVDVRRNIEEGVSAAIAED